MRARLVNQHLDALLHLPAVLLAFLRLLILFATRPVHGLTFDAVIDCYLLHELLLALADLSDQGMHAVPVLTVVFILFWLPDQKLAGHSCWRLGIIVDEVEDAAPVLFILVARVVIEIL